MQIMKIQTILLISVLLFTVSTDTNYKLFTDDQVITAKPDNFVEQHNQKQMLKQQRFFEDGSDLATFRALVSSQNVRLIQKHNSKSDKTYTLYPYPRFVGLTLPEIRAKFLNPISFTPGSTIKNTEITLPKSFPEGVLRVTKYFGKGKNWLEEKKVSPVKDQGACGSCYAYAALSEMEFNLKIIHEHRPFFDLSEQQVLECSSPFGNQGCNGGFMHFVYNYSRKSGIQMESDYPTKLETSQNGTIQECNYSKSARQIKVRKFGFTSPYINDCLRLAQRLQRGTATAAISAGNTDFMYYQSGVLNACGNQTADLDHGVHVVGYESSKNNGGFWLIKNSWGVEWGQNGYVRIDNSLGDGNLCQVCTINSFSQE